MSAHSRAALLAGLALMLLLPGQALASSIAFIKDDNVWLISPDGSRQKQVTTDGTATRSYAFPSQADDGTILAKLGEQFVRVRPDGTKLGDPVPAMGSDIRHSGNLTVMAGPAAPKISPDGTRFAYWISARSLTSCPIWDPGCSYDDTDYTIVSHVDRFTEPGEFGAVRDYRDPSWIGNDRLLVFNHGLGVLQGAISTVGAGEPGLQQWFDPPSDLPQIAQGELTRNGDKLAVLAGYSAVGFAEEYVYLYSVSAGYPAPPEPKCYISDGAPPSGKFMQPSWSPDGTQLALTESDGIHVFSNIPDLRVESPNCGQITDQTLVYGSEPGWGPADVPTGSAPAPPASAGGGGGAAPQTAPMADLAVGERQKGRAVRVGLRVQSAGSTVRVRLLAGKRGRLMGAAVERGAEAGRLTLKVPLNRRGRAALRHNRRLRLSVEVAVTAPGGSPMTTTRPVTLRR
jgi:hypothetical protein